MKVQENIIRDGVIYLKAGKRYRIKSEEESKTLNKINVVVDSEIKGIELLIEINKKNIERTKTSKIARS